MPRSQSKGQKNVLVSGDRDHRHNQTGSNIEKDKLVRDQGRFGAYTKIIKAQATNEQHASGDLMVTNHLFQDGEAGEVVPWKVVENVNTLGASIGDPVYLSDTAGSWSLTPGTYTVQVGIVLEVSATTGSILLNPMKYRQRAWMNPINWFKSTEQTGTGSSQNVAHGLGRAPKKVMVMVTEYSGTGAFDIAEGAHTSTNVVVTVTSGLKFVVVAV